MNNISIQKGVLKNAEAISALAIQVFLDTYATEGVRADLAAEAFSEYSTAQFERRLGESGRMFLLAKRENAIIGFAEFTAGPVPIPTHGEDGAELVRLYIQPGSQRFGIGKKLLAEAEQMLVVRGGNRLWLTVWEKNERALNFYWGNGYHSIATMQYELQGKVYGNKVLSKPLKPAAK